MSPFCSLTPKTETQHQPALLNVHPSSPIDSVCVLLNTGDLRLNMWLERTLMSLTCITEEAVRTDLSISQQLSRTDVNMMTRWAEVHLLSADCCCGCLCGRSARYTTPTRFQTSAVSNSLQECVCVCVCVHAREQCVQITQGLRQIPVIRGWHMIFSTHFVTAHFKLNVDTNSSQHKLLLSAVVVLFMPGLPKNLIKT